MHHLRRRGMTRLDAPWTPEQVAKLNDYQLNGEMHPFTCGVGTNLFASSVNACLGVI